MIITEYASVSAVKSARVKEYDWNEFCKKIGKPCAMVGTTRVGFNALPKDFTRDKKTGKILDCNENCQMRIKNLAGGAVFGEMKIPEGCEAGRGRKYFPTRSAIVFDFENCNTDIYERIEKGLKDFTYAYHSTCKHNPPEDVRLHIIIPFENSTDWKLYSVVAVELARKVGLQGLDVTSLRRAQMELYCVKLRESEYVHKIHNVKDNNDNVKLLNVESYLMEHYGTLDITELTEKIKIDWNEFSLKELARITKTITRKVNNKKVVVKVAKSCDFKPQPPRGGDVKSCFNAVFSVRDILDTLIQYTSCGERYTYYRGSGVGGVWVNEYGTRAGSYHENSGDPLFGRSLTAYDIFLEFYTDKVAKYQDRLRAAHKYAKEKRGEKYEKLFNARRVF